MPTLRARWRYGTFQADATAKTPCLKLTLYIDDRLERAKNKQIPVNLSTLQLTTNIYHNENHPSRCPPINQDQFRP